MIDDTTWDEATRPTLDPLSWGEDPPTEVVLAVEPDQLVLVENLLGAPGRTEQGAGGLLATYVVTNRAVFRWRLYELGTRVRVVAPDVVRDEMLAELRAMVGTR